MIGRVTLVGAGPGDPGLITVRGLAALRAAEVVVYDRLVSPELLEAAPDAAVRIYVGEPPAGPRRSQAEINALLIAQARGGNHVVRLKGGDPFVFGRGAEEALALAAAGIPFEVVPGISSAVAVPGCAGIPMTHRGVASSFAVVTGHEEDGCRQPRVDWSLLATAVDTLVVLMGARRLRGIAIELLGAGRPADTPVALIRWGTTESEETIVSTLGVVATGAIGLPPPVVVVIGDVVSVAQQLRLRPPDAA